MRIDKRSLWGNILLTAFLLIALVDANLRSYNYLVKRGDGSLKEDLNTCKIDFKLKELISLSSCSVEFEQCYLRGYSDAFLCEGCSLVVDPEQNFSGSTDSDCVCTCCWYQYLQNYCFKKLCTDKDELIRLQEYTGSVCSAAPLRTNVKPYTVPEDGEVPVLSQSVNSEEFDEMIKAENVEFFKSDNNTMYRSLIKGEKEYLFDKLSKIFDFSSLGGKPSNLLLKRNWDQYEKSAEIDLTKFEREGTVEYQGEEEDEEFVYPERCDDAEGDPEETPSTTLFDDEDQDGDYGVIHEYITETGEEIIDEDGQVHQHDPEDWFEADSTDEEISASPHRDSPLNGEHHTAPHDLEYDNDWLESYDDSLVTHYKNPERLQKRSRSSQEINKADAKRLNATKIHQAFLSDINALIKYKDDVSLEMMEDIFENFIDKADEFFSATKTILGVNKFKTFYGAYQESTQRYKAFEPKLPHDQLCLDWSPIITTLNPYKWLGDTDSVLEISGCYLNTLIQSKLTGSCTNSESCVCKCANTKGLEQCLLGYAKMSPEIKEKIELDISKFCEEPKSNIKMAAVAAVAAVSVEVEESASEKIENDLKFLENIKGVAASLAFTDDLNDFTNSYIVESSMELQPSPNDPNFISSKIVLDKCDIPNELTDYLQFNLRSCDVKQLYECKNSYKGSKCFNFQEEQNPCNNACCLEIKMAHCAETHCRTKKPIREFKKIANIVCSRYADSHVTNGTEPFPEVVEDLRTLPSFYDPSKTTIEDSSSTTSSVSNLKRDLTAAFKKTKSTSLNPSPVYPTIQYSSSSYQGSSFAATSSESSSPSATTTLKSEISSSMVVKIPKYRTKTKSAKKKLTTTTTTTSEDCPEPTDAQEGEMTREEWENSRKNGPILRDIQDRYQAPKTNTKDPLDEELPHFNRPNKEVEEVEEPENDSEKDSKPVSGGNGKTKVKRDNEESLWESEVQAQIKLKDRGDDVKARVGESVCEIEEFSPGFYTKKCDRREVKDCIKQGIRELKDDPEHFCPYCVNDNAYDECRCACCIGRYFSKVCYDPNCVDLSEKLRYKRYVKNICHTKPIKKYLFAREVEENQPLKFYAAKTQPVEAIAVDEYESIQGIDRFKSKTQKVPSTEEFDLFEVYEGLKSEDDSSLFVETKPINVNKGILNSMKKSVLRSGPKSKRDSPTLDELIASENLDPVEVTTSDNGQVVLFDAVDFEREDSLSNSKEDSTDRIYDAAFSSSGPANAVNITESTETTGEISSQLKSEFDDPDEDDDYDEDDEDSDDEDDAEGNEEDDGLWLENYDDDELGDDYGDEYSDDDDDDPKDSKARLVKRKRRSGDFEALRAKKKAKAKFQKASSYAKHGDSIKKKQHKINRKVVSSKNSKLGKTLGVEAARGKKVGKPTSTFGDAEEDISPKLKGARRASRNSARDFEKRLVKSGEGPYKREHRPDLSRNFPSPILYKRSTNMYKLTDLEKEKARKDHSNLRGVQVFADYASNLGSGDHSNSSTLNPTKKYKFVTRTSTITRPRLTSISTSSQLLNHMGVDLTTGYTNSTLVKNVPHSNSSQSTHISSLAIEVSTQSTSGGPLSSVTASPSPSMSDVGLLQVAHESALDPLNVIPLRKPTTITDTKFLTETITDVSTTTNVETIKVPGTKVVYSTDVVTDTIKELECEDVTIKTRFRPTTETETEYESPVTETSIKTKFKTIPLKTVTEYEESDQTVTKVLTKWDTDYETIFDDVSTVVSTTYKSTLTTSLFKKTITKFKKWGEITTTETTTEVENYTKTKWNHEYTVTEWDEVVYKTKVKSVVSTAISTTTETTTDTTTVSVSTTTTTTAPSAIIPGLPIPTIPFGRPSLPIRRRDAIPEDEFTEETINEELDQIEAEDDYEIIEIIERVLVDEDGELLSDIIEDLQNITELVPFIPVSVNGSNETDLSNRQYVNETLRTPLKSPTQNRMVSSSNRYQLSSISFYTTLASIIFVSLVLFWSNIEN
ncbi:hypothetical protein WICPIJ_001506 [Wickerhamomyces pijperi]|uniref:Uncharacterized protein n=1 Tax=Wickerhamomyces pijperi TaxID=599730 RepID=A0A9P8QAP0_WICPI|nr:hypothetical protein WICPIJ_001506 [Wickerhamomyces pijperi]